MTFQRVETSMVQASLLSRLHVHDKNAAAASVKPLPLHWQVLPLPTTEAREGCVALDEW